MGIEEINRLSKDINDLCKELDNKWSINTGGCCFVSSIIAKHLEKLKIKYKLVLYFYEGDNGWNPPSWIKQGIKDRNVYRFPSGENTCSHYAIYIPKIKKFLNKPNRFSKSKYERMFINGINCSDLTWIYDTGEWNDIYNRSNNGPITKRLNSIFKKYEKESEKFGN